MMDSRPLNEAIFVDANTMVTKQPNGNDNSDTPAVLRPDPVADAGSTSNITEHPIEMPASGNGVAANQPQVNPTNTTVSQPVNSTTPSGVVENQNLGTAQANVVSVKQSGEALEASKNPQEGVTTPLGNPMNTPQTTEPDIARLETPDNTMFGVNLGKELTHEDVLTNASPKLTSTPNNVVEPVSKSTAPILSAQPTPDGQPVTTTPTNDGAAAKAGAAVGVAGAAAATTMATADSKVNPAATPTTAPVTTPGKPKEGKKEEDKEKKKELEKQAKDTVKDLDKETEKMKKARGPEPKPPKPKGSGSGKASKGIAAAVLLLLLGFGSFAGIRLMQQNQESRSQAGSIGQGYCESPKGLKVASISSPGQVGDLGYKPMTSNVTDPASTYDVSKGEIVTFKTKIENDTDKDITDKYEYGAQLVQEAPVGTAVDYNTPISEEQMYDIHYGEGTKQTGRFHQPWQNFTVEANSTTELVMEWKPTSNDCGMYQLDMAVEDFYNTGSSGYCSDDAIVSAGFIRVIGCEKIACNESCTSDAECEAVDPGYFCMQNSTWENTKSNFDGAGNNEDQLTSFNAFKHASDYMVQAVVRGGGVYQRDNESGWSAWSDDLSSNFDKAGSGEIVSFSTYLHPDGRKIQHLVRDGIIYVRDDSDPDWGNGGGWNDVTSNISESATLPNGEITSFKVHVKSDGYIYQHVVIDGQVWARNNKDGFRDQGWENHTGYVDGVGGGSKIIGFNVVVVDNDTSRQTLIRENTVYTREVDNDSGVCRLKENPSSETCGIVECVTECTSETDSGWGECNYCNPQNYSSDECIEREIVCRTKGVKYVGLKDPKEYPAPLNGSTNQDRIKWFNWGQAQQKLSCGTACGMGAVCCAPPGEPTATPTATPINTPTATPIPDPLACNEIQPKAPNLALGGSQVFTCSGIPTERTDFANFQYRVGSGGEWKSISRLESNSLQASLKITEVGDYEVRCQACEGEVGSADCSDWQTL